MTIAPLAGGDPAQYAALAAALALVMGAVMVLGGLLHLGFMADFFSKPVLLGYINGTALTIIASQLGKLLGVSISEQDFFPMLREVLSELGDVDPLTLLISISLLGLAFLLRRVAPKVPATLVVVVVAIVASVTFDLEDEGVAVVGDVEAGLPPIGLPGVGLDEIADLILPACAFALIAFADTIGSARTYAAKNGYEIDPNRELAGLGGANIASGISAAFPVSASGSRTALNDSAGGRTQLVGIATAVLVAIIALFATALIEPLPMAALGVVVVVAAIGLFDVRSIWRLRRVREAEFAWPSSRSWAFSSSACSEGWSWQSRSRLRSSCIAPCGRTTRFSERSRTSTDTTTSPGTRTPRRCPASWSTASTRPCSSRTSSTSASVFWGSSTPSDRWSGSS